VLVLRWNMVNVSNTCQSDAIKTCCYRLEH
jgi:hypothetical protein